MKKRGFTLIELLVVIAIIGILAAIVLVSLSGARTKAKNAAIKGTMSQIRSVAESYYLEQATGTYVGLDADTNYTTLVTGIEGNGGTVKVDEFGADEYCVQFTLAGTGNGKWCVDSTGYVGATSVCDAVAGDMDCAAD